MSGIAGIIHLDGKPLEPGLIEKMTGEMTHRGPDGIHHWIKGSVALGHCDFHVSEASVEITQPYSDDGTIWITADARIDGRPELIRTLGCAGHHIPLDSSNAELILHAYEAFDEGFLEHLIGDFAFAIWDTTKQTLICARDHFGVRPFFYIKTNGILIFASEIEALFKHPKASSLLDEQSIGDFLLFGHYQDLSATIYKNIRRLPPAHCLKLSQHYFSVRPYWSLPTSVSVRYADDRDYVDEFGKLFQTAVQDRIVGAITAVDMSGGLDSTSIAAVAKPYARSLTAHTATFHGMVADDVEGYFASMVAAHLEIPIFYQRCDEYDLFQRDEDPSLATCEPYGSSDKSFHYDRQRQVTDNGARVLLTGHGGDALFHQLVSSRLQMVLSGNVAGFLTEIFGHIRKHRSLRGLGLRSSMMRWTGTKFPVPTFPEWIDDDFARRAHLRDRWEQGWIAMADADTGGTASQLRAPWVPAVFEGYERLKIPLSATHPFFDRRLVEFALQIPEAKKSNKNILREAMRGMLPEPVRIRPKESSTSNLFRSKLALGKIAVQLEIDRLGVEGYINGGQYAQLVTSFQNGATPRSMWYNHYVIAPIALKHWLARHAR